jgi:hypothetical protein
MIVGLGSGFESPYLERPGRHWQIWQMHQRGLSETRLGCRDGSPPKRAPGDNTSRIKAARRPRQAQPCGTCTPCSCSSRGGGCMEASVLANPPAAVMGKCMRPRSPSSCSRSCGGHAGRCSCPAVLASCGGDAGRFPRPRVNAPRHRCAHCRLATRGQRITGVGLPGSAHAAWRPQAHSGCAQQGRERWGGPAHMGQARARAASAAGRFQSMEGRANRCTTSTA